MFFSYQWHELGAVHWPVPAPLPGWLQEFLPVHDPIPEPVCFPVQDLDIGTTFTANSYNVWRCLINKLKSDMYSVSESNWE